MAVRFFSYLGRCTRKLLNWYLFAMSVLPTETRAPLKRAILSAYMPPALVPSACTAHDEGGGARGDIGRYQKLPKVSESREYSTRV